MQFQRKGLGIIRRGLNDIKRVTPVVQQLGFSRQILLLPTQRMPLLLEPLFDDSDMYTLKRFGTDFTKLAQEDKLDPVIGRQQQIDRVIQILCRRRKSNPCLIGDPGVGKTVIVEGLAQLIVNGLVPPKLRGKKVFSIDMGRLVAGTTYVGDFEKRVTMLIDEVMEHNGRIILFIDELHTMIGTGSGVKDNNDAANLLKPALARGDLKCIGATTLDEYRKHVEKDPALARRFNTVEVPEPSIDETIEILKGLKKKYETHYNVRYADEAIVAAAHLSSRYIRDRFLPDKAIDLIDEAGSRVHLNQYLAPVDTLFVTEMEVQYLVSSWTGIPVDKVTYEDSLKLLRIEETLRKHIVGQDEAIKAISRAIRRARAGIRDPSRPIASFLFTGLTGVGKTELAKAIAIEYFGSKEAMVRLDMSEYMDRYTATKLIGSPPGYIGYEVGGQLTNAVRRRPHNVILFDEIEKAHQDVFDLMLQILDDGRLTDSQGRTVDFKNTLIIMTSNIGNSLIAKSHHPVGFKTIKAEVEEELKNNFRPEFLNRLDEVIVFRKLKNSEMKKILDIMLKEVHERLKEKNIDLIISDSFKDKLIEEAYCPSYGARPLRRAIMKHLEDSLAERILSGDIKEGDSVTFDVNLEGNIIMY